MIPQYVRKVAPQYTLPGGQMAVANVGVGHALAQLGGQIQVAAERKLVREDSLAVSRTSRDSDQRLLDYFLGIKDRREELSRTQIDPVTGSTVTGYQVEIEGFGTKLDEEFARASADLSIRAKEEFEKRFNARAPIWGKFAADTLSTLELEDITTEIEDLAKTDRVADAKELFELYSDRYSPTDRRRIEATIDEAAVEARLSSARSYLQNAASAQGWEAAVALIDDPDWQKAMGLDIADAARVHNDLSTFARTQEGKESRAVDAEKETAKNNMFADARQDKLDPATIDPALRAGIVTPAEAKQLQTLVEKGPPTENDPDLYMQSQAWISRVEDDPSQKAKALAWHRAHAARLTPATFESAIADVEKAGDSDDLLSAPTAKLLLGLMKENYDLGFFGPSKTAASHAATQRAYANARQRFSDYVRSNPEASDDELNARYRSLTAPATRHHWLQRLGRSWFTALANPPLYEFYHAIDKYTPPVTFEQADDAEEPETEAAFEATVKSLPAGSQAQKNYYEKWVGKWR